LWGGGGGGGGEGVVVDMVLKSFEGAGVFVLRVVLESKGVSFAVRVQCSAGLLGRF